MSIEVHGEPTSTQKKRKMSVTLTFLAGAAFLGAAFLGAGLVAFLGAGFLAAVFWIHFISVSTVAPRSTPVSPGEARTGLGRRLHGRGSGRVQHLGHGGARALAEAGGGGHHLGLGGGLLLCVWVPMYELNLHIYVHGRPSAPRGKRSMHLGTLGRALLGRGLLRGRGHLHGDGLLCCMYDRYVDDMVSRR